MITISLDQGPHTRPKIEFRPASERNTPHGKLMLASLEVLDLELKGLRLPFEAEKGEPEVPALDPELPPQDPEAGEIIEPVGDVAAPPAEVPVPVTPVDEEISEPAPEVEAEIAAELPEPEVEQVVGEEKEGDAGTVEGV